jgi:sigma-B regulation protein RsbU (phosphoserine phosphatase)
MAVRAGTPLTGIVRHLNEQLHDDLSGGRSVTMWLAELHAGQDALIGFSAGQGPLLHLVAGSAQVRRLLPDAPPLGLLRGMAVQPGEPVQLAAGDVFAVISDGVFEARNAADEMFGVERVAGLLMRSAGESAERICERLREELAAFTGDTPASDDRTVILIKRTPDAATSSGSAAPAAPGPGGLP